MILDFANLSEQFFTISDIFAVKQYSGEKITIDMCDMPRQTDAFLFFSSGTAICYQKGRKPLFVPQGALMYMPKGSLYTWDILPSPETGSQERYLFEFSLRQARINRSKTVKKAVTPVFTDTEIHFSNEIIIASNRQAAHYRELLQQLTAVFQTEPLPQLALYQAAYAIFSAVANDRAETHDPFETIRPGIRHLETTLDFGTCIGDAAAACCVSIRYFEKLFKAYAGTTPKAYLNSRRTYYIKSMLYENRFTLNQIAETLSFCDSGYLCRFFKQQTGMTTLEYKQLFRRNSEYPME